MIKRILVALAISTITAFAWSDAYEAGETTLDFQNPGCQGDRIAIDDSNNVHICWTCSKSQDTLFADKAVYYNLWNADQGFSCEGGIKVPGNNITGFCTMGLLPDGRAVIACNEGLDGDEASVVFIDSDQGTGDFVNKVYVDTLSVNPQPLYPHIGVDVDGVIHVIARSMDPADSASSRIYHSRSTDEGVSFSPWMALTEDAGDDAAMAVSKDGSKVCVAWMSQVDVEGGGTAFRCGHIYYMESANSGQDWGEPVKVTDGRYTDLLPDDPDTMYLLANYRNIDCAYGGNDEVVIAWTEGFHTYDSSQGLLYHPRQWARSVIWFESSGNFGCPTAGFPMFFNVDTLTGDTLWEIDSLGLWGVPQIVGELHGGQYCPQLAAWGQNMICMFGGQYDSFDLSGGGTVNGDLYGTVTDDDGITWHPLADYDPSEIGTVWERITNITNTPSRGAGVGATMDEDYHTVWPWVDDIIHITYIQDKFSGSIFPEVGPAVITTNPVEYLRFHLWPAGVDETPASSSVISISPFTGQIPVHIYLSSPLTTNGVLRVRNVLGQTVRTYELEAGIRSLTWDGMDTRGLAAPAGVYFAELRSGSEKAYGKVTLLR